MMLPNWRPCLKPLYLKPLYLKPLYLKPMGPRIAAMIRQRSIPRVWSRQ